MLATWLLVAAWPAGAGAIQATPPAASVATSQSAVDLGDSFIYQVTVEGATDAKPPTLPPSDAWDAEYMGVHVTLNGLRGLLAPFLAVGLYQWLQSLGHAPWIFLVCTVVNVIGALGFVLLRRDRRRRATVVATAG